MSICCEILVAQIIVVLKRVWLLEFLGEKKEKIEKITCVY